MFVYPERQGNIEKLPSVCRLVRYFFPKVFRGNPKQLNVATDIFLVFWSFCSHWEHVEFEWHDLKLRVVYKKNIKLQIHSGTITGKLWKSVQIGLTGSNWQYVPIFLEFTFNLKIIIYPYIVENPESDLIFLSLHDVQKLEQDIFFHFWAFKIIFFQVVR